MNVKWQNFPATKNVRKDLHENVKQTRSFDMSDSGFFTTHLCVSMIDFYYEYIMYKTKQS